MPYGAPTRSTGAPRRPQPRGAATAREGGAGRGKQRPATRACAAALREARLPQRRRRDVLVAAAAPSQWAPSFRDHPRPAPGPPTAPQCPSHRSVPPSLQPPLPRLQRQCVVLRSSSRGHLQGVDPRYHPAALSRPPQPWAPGSIAEGSSGKLTPPENTTDP